MKLQYKILWFDDSAEIFDSLDLDYLKNQISEWGFVPDIDLVTTPEGFLEKSPYGEYDLLVVDFNLEGYGHGQDFIAQVRGQEVFTEIIFYSSGSASLLWDAVHQHKLEGIYIANKDGILERIIKVGQQTLRKVLDLENMRGIVMAEVGDLDLLLNSILVAAIGGLGADTQKEIFGRFYKACSEHHDSHKASLDSFNEAPTVEFLLSLCDSDKRWQNYGRARKHHEVLKKKELGDYVVEILRPRNFLAHGVPSRTSDGSCIFMYQGKDYLFDEATSTALRTRIITYKSILTEIRDELAAQQAVA
jgi:hypothetical protein